jgi:hypothetical protein
MVKWLRFGVEYVPSVALSQLLSSSKQSDIQNVSLLCYTEGRLLKADKIDQEERRQAMVAIEEALLFGPLPPLPSSWPSHIVLQD